MTDEGRDEETRGPDRLATERAEELVNRAARGAGYLVSLVGLRLLRGASLAREEAEDIWAEAQSLRHERQGAESDVVESDVVESDVVESDVVESDVVESDVVESDVVEPDVVEPDMGSGHIAETIKATEAARRKAEELDLNLAEIPATGASGQITLKDVEKRAKAERP